MLPFPPMKCLLPILLLAAACSSETPAVVEPTDTREPIEVMYVAAPQTQIRTQASDTAAVITTYPIGDAVSVLAKQGDWVEIRTGDKTGWVRSADLQTAQQQASGESDPAAKFLRMPLPISAPSAKGEIYIEASVNTDGDVTDTRILSNTTGSESLAHQNTEQLKAAKFYPMTVDGARKTFKYYHRVTY